ncbi:MAG: hypothetical protein QOJ13_2808 [Gaiellales bacterium]|jgi:hypothetical protein|nr:hypothetical protein [Gaiellales bacterium]
MAQDKSRRTLARHESAHIVAAVRFGAMPRYMRLDEHHREDTGEHVLAVARFAWPRKTTDPILHPWHDLIVSLAGRMAAPDGIEWPPTFNQARNEDLEDLRTILRELVMAFGGGPEASHEQEARAVEMVERVYNGAINGARLLLKLPDVSLAIDALSMQVEHADVDYVTGAQIDSIIRPILAEYREAS